MSLLYRSIAITSVVLAGVVVLTLQLDGRHGVPTGDPTSTPAPITPIEKDRGIEIDLPEVVVPPQLIQETIASLPENKVGEHTDISETIDTQLANSEAAIDITDAPALRTTPLPVHDLRDKTYSITTPSSVSDESNFAQISMAYYNGLTEKLLQAGLIVIRIDTQNGSYRLMPSQNDVSPFLVINLEPYNQSDWESQIRISDLRFLSEIKMQKIKRYLPLETRSSENLTAHIVASSTLEAQIQRQHAYARDSVLVPKATDAMDGKDASRLKQASIGDMTIFGCFDQNIRYGFRATSVQLNGESINLSDACI